MQFSQTDGPTERAWAMRRCILFFANNEIFWIARANSRKMAFSLLSYSFVLFHRKKLRREKGGNTASELTKFYNASLKRATLQFGEFEFSLSCAYFFLFFLLSFLPLDLHYLQIWRMDYMFVVSLRNWRNLSKVTSKRVHIYSNNWVKFK